MQIFVFPRGRRYSRETLLNTISNLSLIYIPAVPCPPTNVTAAHTCGPEPVPVSWVLSDTAKYYTAVATSFGGHRSECSTNETSCSLPGLQCGEVYAIGVSGADDNCTGQAGSIVLLDTGNKTLTATMSSLVSDSIRPD